MKAHYIFPLFFGLLLAGACRKSNSRTQHVSGRYIDGLTGKGLAAEGFEIVESQGGGFIQASQKRTTLKTTTTDAEGYFDFGKVSFRQGSDQTFVVGNSTSERFEDVYQFGGASQIDPSEDSRFYNFFIVPGTRRIYIKLNKVSSLSPGDTLYYTLVSKYLRDKGEESAFSVRGSSGYQVPDWRWQFYKGPAGKYYVSVFKRIGGVASSSQDTVTMAKGQDFEYTINF